MVDEIAHKRCKYPVVAAIPEQVCNGHVPFAVPAAPNVRSCTGVSYCVTTAHTAATQANEVGQPGAAAELPVHKESFKDSFGVVELPIQHRPGLHLMLWTM